MRMSNQAVDSTTSRRHAPCLVALLRHGSRRRAVVSHFGRCAQIMKQPLTFIILSLALLVGCKESIVQDGSFIEHRGTHELRQGVLLEVFQDTNGLLNLRHTRSNGNISEWTKGTIEEETNWFLYVSAFNEVWLATEDDLVLLHEGEKSSGSYSIFSCSKPNELSEKTFSKVPEEVAARLDPRLTQKIQRPQQADGSNG